VGYPDLPVFLGVGRYKGTWNANTNSGTLATGNWKDLQPLFASGSVGNRAPNNLGGYGANINLTATLGDFWKVTTAGSTPVDGEDTWRISDFIVFTYNSGSTSGSTWQKLSYTDTVSSIMYGNGSGGSTVFGLSAADVHEFTGSLYVSGALFAEELNTTSHNHTVITSIIEKSGSTRFGDSPGDLHQFSGSVYTGGNLAVSGTYAPYALTVHGETGVAEYIRHVGDNDTNIRFEDDKMTVTVGNEAMITMTEDGSQDKVVIGDSGDIDFQVSAGAANALFVEGATAKVGLGTASPSHTLTVAGDISGSGKILNVGGIETQGTIGATGSITTRGGFLAKTNGSAAILNLTSSHANFSIQTNGRALRIYDANETSWIMRVEDSKFAFASNDKPTHPLTVTGDMSGSGKLFSLGGIETAGALNVSGSTILGSANNDTHTFNGTVTSNDPVVMMDNMDVSGTVILHGQTLRLTSSAQNTDIYVAQAGRGLWIYNRSGDNGLDYNLVMYDNKVQVGAASVPTHPLTVAGDMSGSGMLTAVGGVTTAGDANISGSAGVRGNVVCLGTVYTIDMSGSGKIRNVGGIETAGDLGVTGSATVRNMLTHLGDLSGSGKILNVGGIETAGDLGVTGSANISGSVRIFGTVGGSLEMSGTATNSHFKLLHQMKGLSLYDASHENYIWRAQNERLQIGSNNVPSHTLTVAGDLSGSGKILNVGGIETQGDFGATGSLTVRGTSVINGNSRFASSAQIGYAAAASVTHPLMVSGDMSGSGKIFNLGGIETAGALNVSGSTIFGQKAADVHQFSGSVYVSGNVYAEQFHTTIHNQTVYSSTLHKSGSTEFGNTNDDTHTFIGTVIANDPARFLDDLDVSGSLTAHESIRITGTLGDYSWGIGGRMLRLLDTNASTFPYITLDNKTGIGNITPTHTLTVAGDLSGSGKIFNLGGIETAADLGVTGSVTAGNVMPRTDNTFDLGSASKRWANIYTGDLHLKNDRGDWTIVEEEDYLSVINNKTSKKYKMVLEEIED